MSTIPISEKLYALLPLVYRQRDAAQGQPLRALLAVMEQELQRIDEDIAQLYDNWFIETCASWVIPYIADLLDVKGLQPIPGTSLASRAFVANVLAFRRRKGTASVIERLAEDVTGWPARVVEFFQRLATTQYMNHVRLDDLATVDLHDAKALELLGGPFETAQHTLDVRHIRNGRGRYNIPNVGIFLWRLRSFPATDVPATPAAEGPGFFRMSPLGNDIPLFRAPALSADVDARTREDQVPEALRRRPLYDELEALRATPSAVVPDDPAFRALISIDAGGSTLSPGEIMICDLSTFRRPPASINYQTSVGTFARPITAAVDPVLGRIAFSSATPPTTVHTNYSYGFSSEVGGGFYNPRRITPELANEPAPVRTYPVSGGGTGIDDALAQWQADGRPSPALIEVQDNEIYHAATWTIPDGSVEIRGSLDDGNRPRNPLILPATAGGSIGIVLGQVGAAPGAGSGLRLTSMLISAPLAVTVRNTATLALRHLTVVPGISLTSAGAPVAPTTPSLVAQIDPATPNATIAVTLLRAITGALVLPFDPSGVSLERGRLSIQDSIVDGVADGAVAITAEVVNIQRSTVFGSTQAGEIELASDSIFTDRIDVARTQIGCVRFCFVPIDSRIPRAFRCQPAQALEDLGSSASADDQNLLLIRMVPSFESVRYGTPNYAALRTDTPTEILGGASDESEMGVFQHLHQAQRLENLATVVDEYLRFGLEAGALFAPQLPPPPSP